MIFIYKTLYVSHCSHFLAKSKDARENSLIYFFFICFPGYIPLPSHLPRLAWLLENLQYQPIPKPLDFTSMRKLTLCVLFGANIVSACCQTCLFISTQEIFVIERINVIASEVSHSVAISTALNNSFSVLQVTKL